jgi:flagellar protein FliS
MWNSSHNAYLESKVLAADPVELVTLLYQACRQSVRDAREHLAAGRIGERSRAISKACEILIELGSALDRDRGGELSERLALLYDYMQRRLLEANMQQSDEPLVEVLGLLTTLGEAWEGIHHPSAKGEIQGESPWSHSPAMEPAAATGSAHAWSF